MQYGLHGLVQKVGSWSSDQSVRGVSGWRVDSSARPAQ